MDKVAVVAVVAVVASLATVAVGQAEPADADALLRFYYEFNGPEWTTVDWGLPPNLTAALAEPPVDVCAFPGVACGGSPGPGGVRVTQLVLQNTNMQGTLEGSSLFGLTGLTDVDFSNDNGVPADANRIAGSFDLFAALPGLVGLSMRSAGVETQGQPLPYSIFELTTLRVVDLPSNGFSGTLTEALCGSSFQARPIVLRLHDNNLEGRLPSCMQFMMPTLEELDVSANQITGLLGNWGSTETSLRVLRVNNNPLGRDIFSLPSNLFPQLTVFSAGSTGAAGEIPLDFLTQFPLLETIALGSNLLSGALPDLSTPQTLRSVFLSSNRLTGAFPPFDVGQFAGGSIYLASNRLSGPIPPEYLDQIVNGEVDVDICNNFIPCPLSPQFALVNCEFCVCPDGSSAEDPQSECEPCDDGEVHPESQTNGDPESGVGECGDCGEGTQPNDSRGACELCPFGTFKRDGDDQCQTCDGLTEDDRSECGTCPAGSRIVPTELVDGEVVAESCDLCDLGFFGAVENERGGCSPCEIGFFNNARGATECSVCQDGFVAEKNTTIDCTPCGIGAHVDRQPDGGAPGCVPCPERTYNTELEGLEECLTCPRGGVCEGGDLAPYPQPGFWVDEAGDGAFLECPNPDACLGGRSNECAEGRVGALCSECKEGHYSFQDRCLECPSEAAQAMSLIAFFVVFIIVFFFFFKFAGEGNKFVSVAVGLTFMQIASITLSFDLDWPGPLRDLLRFLSFANLDIEAASPECSIDGFGYEERYYVSVLMPLIIIGLLQVVYIPLWLLSRCTRRLRRGATYVRNRLVAGSLLFLTIVYLNSASRTLELFDCTRQANGVYTMDAHPSIRCRDSERWQAMLPAGIFFTVTYIFFVPFFLYRILRRGAKKDLLDDRNFRLRYGTLFTRYKREYYWFELCIIARKILFIIPDLFLSNRADVAAPLAMLILLAALGVQLRRQPYAHGILNRLDALLMFVTIIILAGGLMFSYGSFSTETAIKVSYFFVFLIVLSICAIIHVGILEARSQVRRLKGRGDDNFAALPKDPTDDILKDFNEDDDIELAPVKGKGKKGKKGKQDKGKGKAPEVTITIEDSDGGASSVAESSAAGGDGKTLAPGSNRSKRSKSNQSVQSNRSSRSKSNQSVQSNRSSRSKSNQSNAEGGSILADDNALAPSSARSRTPSATSSAGLLNDK